MKANSKYILDIESMRPGDIVLTSERTIRSKGVRKATKGNFSHAILFVGDGSYIHSDGRGVHANNTQRLLFDAPANAKVLRLKGGETRAIEMLCAFARDQIGKEYSIPQAVRSRKNRSKQTQDISNRQFCSRLVAQAYAFAGIALVTNPAYCYPKDIEDSPLLEIVENCVREASDEEVRFATSESPLDVQTKATNFILERARQITGHDIQTLGQMAEHLLKAPEHDQAIAQVVKESGYLNLWQTDYIRNPWRYNSTILLSQDIPREQKIATATRELAYGERQLSQFRSMYAQYMLLWQQAQLSYFALELQLYLTLIDLHNQRVAAAKEVLQKA